MIDFGPMNRKCAVAVFLGACQVLAACSGPSAGGSAIGTIEGLVTLGPIEPVCQVNKPCDGAPFALAKIVVITKGGEHAATARTDAGGRYSVTVPAGPVVVTVDVGQPLPRCVPIEVMAAAGAVVQANIDCDTGIR